MSSPSRRGLDEAGEIEFSRFVLVAGALPFLGIGLAFLVAPASLAARVGIALSGATADADVRAVYGGLQLACGALLVAATRRGEWLRLGLSGMVACYVGLAGARVLSLALAGMPNGLGLALLAAELLALSVGLAAWRRLGRAGAARASAPVPAPANATLARAGERDLAALLPLVDAFQRESGYASGDAALHASVAELLRDKRDGCVLIARAGERPLGYAALCIGFSIEFRGRDAFVDELYVVPDARGSGLGRTLLRALEAEARAAGVRALHLEVEQHNAAARRLYEQEGFVALGRELLSKRLGA
jgi:ribosomal protein S18 acetylase RimI-like enzyme